MFFTYIALFLVINISKVLSECCPEENTSDFCTMYNLLPAHEQLEVRHYLGDSCDGDVDEAIKIIEKRKPNFIRFGRSDKNLFMDKKQMLDPNFLRFGRTSPTDGSKRYERSDPNFLRFGRQINPVFLRFGRSAEPNFLRFGKRSLTDDNGPFLRFERKEAQGFFRLHRKPNFLRFGR